MAGWPVWKGAHQPGAHPLQQRAQGGQLPGLGPGESQIYLLSLPSKYSFSSQEGSRLAYSLPPVFHFISISTVPAAS
jgi:hypothetical protein